MSDVDLQAKYEAALRQAISNREACEEALLVVDFLMEELRVTQDKLQGAEDVIAWWTERDM